jgi:hypothetical protein
MPGGVPVTTRFCDQMVYEEVRFQCIRFLIQTTVDLFSHFLVLLLVSADIPAYRTKKHGIFRADPY